MPDDFWAAGHHFVDGRCILEKTVTEGDQSVKMPCMKRWVDIMHCGSKIYIGTKGVAHSGDLNSTEVGEINARVEKMGPEYLAANAGAGSGIGAPSPDQPTTENYP